MDPGGGADAIAATPAGGDVTGDAQADLTLVHQPGDGKWHLRNSSSSVRRITASGYSWGGATDVPVTGDWDGS